MSMVFRAAHEFISNRVLLLWEEESAPGQRRVIEPLRLSVADVSSHERIDPTLSLSMQEAQAFMDALWLAGVRPAEARSSSGEVNALRDHLEDMRRMVFHGPGSTYAELRKRQQA